jgi:hypothetical protein
MRFPNSDGPLRPRLLGEREKVVWLTPKLIERLRPYVEAQHKGVQENDDLATAKFVNRVERARKWE